MGNGPIFIGGLDRCGKTMLRGMLVSHPNISIPTVGSNYWTLFYRQYGDLGIRANFENCLNAMMHYTHVLVLKPNTERIRTEFLQGEPTYARLFGLFNQHYAEREGKSRWGDQTGLIEGYADEIFSAYPGSKMIHVIRDPRDRYEASLALHPKGQARAGGATARWIYTTKLARRNSRMYPDRYMIIHYENMVMDLEATVRQVCDFLDEEYTPTMIKLEGAPEFIRKTPGDVKENVFGTPVYKDFIGRYKNKISKDEIAFMQLMVGREMERHGYTLDRIRFSLKEAIQYCFKTIPLNMTLMCVWLVMNFSQRELPARFGRKPPKDKLR